jgi:hypothetical protein
VPANDVGKACFREPVVVDTAVLEETPVFDGDDSVDEVLGNLVEGNDLALGAVFATEQR